MRKMVRNLGSIISDKYLQKEYGTLIQSKVNLQTEDLNKVDWWYEFNLIYYKLTIHWDQRAQHHKFCSYCIK